MTSLETGLREAARQEVARAAGIPVLTTKRLRLRAPGAADAMAIADLINERRIAEQITRDEGKPEQAIGKIVEGRLGAFFKDVVLTEQAFVKDPKKTIKQVLAEQGVNVLAFARFQVGQAG